MKVAVEGKTTRVNRSPQVFVTIVSLNMKEGGDINFSTEKFEFTNMEFVMLIDVRGTNTELAAIAAGKAFGTIEQKTGSAASTVGLGGFASKAAQLTKEAASKAAKVGKVGANMVGKAKHQVDGVLHLTEDDDHAKPDDKMPSHKVQITCTVDMLKEFDDDDVSVTVKDFKTENSVINRVMSQNLARGFIEAAISRKVSMAFTKKSKEVKQKMEDKTQEYVYAPLEGVSSQVGAHMSGKITLGPH